MRSHPCKSCLAVFARSEPAPLGEFRVPSRQMSGYPTTPPRTPSSRLGRTVRIGTAPACVSSLRSSLCSVIRGASTASARHKENQNEAIASYECVLASATCCRLQRDTSGSARTSRTARTDWTTRRDGPVRRSGRDGDRGQNRDQGRQGQTGDQGRQGQAAPCPSGEHRYTSPDGTVNCARD